MSSSPLSVVILAAGQGKRMKSALPKVLHRVAGKAMVAHVIDTARTLAPEAICVVVGHGGDQVRAALADQGVVFAQQEQQLGTGHAVQQAMPEIGGEGTTLVLYGDVPLTPARLLEDLAAVARQGRVGLITARLDDPTGYGRIVRDAAGRIQRIVEQKDANDDERAIREINSGIMAIPTQRLNGWLARLSNDNAQGEYYLTDVIGMAVADGVEVEAVLADEADVQGVNSRTQLAQVERLYQARLAAKLMDAGVTLMDPARLDIRGELECEADVTIDINCVFEGSVRIGAGCVIGANCVIRNAQIAAGSRIEPFTHIDGAVVGEDARVGPFARLRPGAVLESANHVGNFVEIKNSRVGAGSKVNHLTYVGDADVGAGVNVGAGTITCNYDGVNKHRTVIQDGAFIGSGTMLVAPVTVEAGATIGAGSTITRTAPADSLTVARARQTTLPGWKRPQKKKQD